MNSPNARRPPPPSAPFRPTTLNTCDHLQHIARTMSARPIYETTRAGGEDHRPLFRCTLRLSPHGYTTDGTGGSKLLSRRDAAQRMLNLLNQRNLEEGEVEQEEPLFYVDREPDLQLVQDELGEVAASPPRKPDVPQDVDQLPPIKRLPVVNPRNRVEETVQVMAMSQPPPAAFSAVATQQPGLPTVPQSVISPAPQNMGPPAVPQVAPPLRPRAPSPLRQNVPPPTLQQSIAPPMRQPVVPPVAHSVASSGRQVFTSASQSVTSSVEQSVATSVQQSVVPPTAQSGAAAVPQVVKPPVPQSVVPPTPPKVPQSQPVSQKVPQSQPVSPRVPQSQPVSPKVLQSQAGPAKVEQSQLETPKVPQSHPAPNLSQSIPTPKPGITKPTSIQKDAAAKPANAIAKQAGKAPQTQSAVVAANAVPSKSQPSPTTPKSQAKQEQVVIVTPKQAIKRTSPRLKKREEIVAPSSASGKRAESSAEASKPKVLPNTYVPPRKRARPAPSTTTRLPIWLYCDGADGKTKQSVVDLVGADLPLELSIYSTGRIEVGNKEHVELHPLPHRGGKLRVALEVGRGVERLWTARAKWLEKGGSKALWPRLVVVGDGMSACCEEGVVDVVTPGGVRWFVEGVLQGAMTT